MTTLVWNYLPEYDTERGFEDEYATYHGVPQCVGVDNGTNAIKLGLRALGFGPGDEVITVSNTAAPTAVAIDSPC